LNEYLQVSKVKNKDAAFSKEDVLSVSGDYGIVNQIEFQGRSFAGVSVAAYGVVETGDVVYTKSPLKSNPYGIIKTNKGKTGIVSTLYAVYKPLNNVHSEFVQIYFEQDARMNNYMHSLVNKGAKNDMKVSDENALKGEVFFPSKDEQIKISKYFGKIDHLITLHQRKCDETKKLKKFMLQKMFPKKDAKKPEIRFARFTDDWEQRKLGDWGDFYYGRSCPKWSVTEDATIPCIRYGELYTKFGAKIDRVYSYTNMPPENLRFSKGTEVLIPRVGGNPMDYNHCTWLSMKDVAIGEMISVFNTDNNPLFTATMFNATLQNEFAMRVEGGSVTNLYFEKLKNIDVSFPSIREQEMIAAYFENIDNLITLHQRKCDELKELKKYMLQNMFPQKG
jgi:type I restriction enzyme S subunit